MMRKNDGDSIPEESEVTRAEDCWGNQCLVETVQNES